MGLEAVASWWGAVDLPEGSIGHWGVGALSLWVENRGHEWYLTYRSTDDPHDDKVAVTVPFVGAIPDGDMSVLRFAGRRTGTVLRVRPVLPDRPVVSRPDVPFYVLGDETAEIYVSSPLWLRLDVPNPEKMLLELPIYRSSDTWFGPNTREGELCYASVTSCRHALADLPFRPHRAVTPVRIRNRTDETVLVERLNLPVPLLPLVATEAGALWTHGIELEIERGGDTAVVRIDRSVPKEAPGARLVASPRSEGERNVFTRALGALIR